MGFSLLYKWFINYLIILLGEVWCCVVQLANFDSPKSL